MKNVLLTILFLLFCSTFVLGQELKTQRDTIDFIWNALKKANEENLVLKNSIRHTDSLLYEEAYNTVSEAIQLAGEIAATFRLVSERLVADRALLYAASGQNISLGNFEKIMLENAELMFEKNDPDTAKINTWKRIVSRIVKSNVLNSVLSSNPVGMAISSVVTVARTFISNKLNSVKGASVIEMRTAITDSKIDGFRQRMDSYFAYYAQLESVNKEFRYDLNDIELRYKTKKDAIITYNSRLSTLLGSKRNDINRIPDLDGLFKRRELYTNVPTSNINFYKDVLNDPKVKKLVEHASLWKAYKYDTESFDREFRTTLVKFLREYRILFDGGQNTRARDLLDNAALKEIMEGFDKAILEHKIDKDIELSF